MSEEKQVIGAVLVAYEGKNINVNVHEDGTVILPNGAVRCVSAEVVAALKAKMEERKKAEEALRLQEEERKRAEEQKAKAEAEQKAIEEALAEAKAKEADAQAAAKAKAEQAFEEEAATKKAAESEAQSVSLPAEKPEEEAASETKPEGKKPKKKKSGLLVAVLVLLAVLVGGGTAAYFYWPQLYNTEIMQNIINHVQMDDADSVQQAADGTDTSTENNGGEEASDSTDKNTQITHDALNGENVSISFYAEILTADGEKYRVPLSSVELDNKEVVDILNAEGVSLLG